jgi:glycosyltransferase involved in cell wall biosynthesis
MKVLHLIDSGGFYGAENVVLNLTLGLRKLGAESLVGCFSYQNKPLPEVGVQAESMGLDCTYFKLRNRFDAKCVRSIASYFRNNKITVLHSHGYKASLVCLITKLLYGTPYVVTCHLWYLGTFRIRIYTSLEKVSMRFADRVIGVSGEIASDLERVGIPKRKLEVIENGIDVDRYSEFKLEPKDAEKVREELGLDRDSIIIGSLGRLTEQKDYQTLIRAAAEALKENEALEFMVAGEGELRSALIKECRDLGIENRFHFLGFRNDKEKLLKLMNVFVLSSLDEGLPIAMLEAMAAGLPVVTTPVGGIPGVIRPGENGLFIEPRNVTQLKEALLLLVGNSAMREELGKRASETVKAAYSIENMAQKYLAIYTSLAPSPSDGGG